MTDQLLILYYCDRLATYSAQCAADLSSSLGTFPVMCHVFVNKIKDLFFFSQKTKMFSCPLHFLPACFSKV